MKLFKIGLICLLFGTACKPRDRFVIKNNSQKDVYLFFDISRKEKSPSSTFINDIVAMNSSTILSVPKKSDIKCEPGSYDWYFRFHSDTTHLPIFIIDKGSLDSLPGSYSKSLSELPSYGILARHDITIDSLEHKMNWTIVYP